MEYCGGKNDIDCASAQPPRVIRWLSHQIKYKTTAEQANARSAEFFYHRGVSINCTSFPEFLSSVSSLGQEGQTFAGGEDWDASVSFQHQQILISRHDGVGPRFMGTSED